MRGRRGEGKSRGNVNDSVDTKDEKNTAMRTGEPMLVIRNRLRKFFHRLLANLLETFFKKDSFYDEMKGKREEKQGEFSGGGNYSPLFTENVFHKAALIVRGEMEFQLRSFVNSFCALNSRLNRARQENGEACGMNDDGMLIVVGYGNLMGKTSRRKVWVWRTKKSFGFIVFVLSKL